MYSVQKIHKGKDVINLNKEELIEIYGLLEHHYCDPLSCFNPNFKLLNKVLSMIEGYCEHEPEGDYHVCVDKCKKCGEIVNDN